MLMQVPDLHEWICPDCGAQPLVTGDGSPLLTCEASCPALASATATQRADALFFEQHPDATEFVRPASWTERTALIAGGMSPEAARDQRIRVVEVWPGFRLRQPITPVVQR